MSKEKEPIDIGKVSKKEFPFIKKLDREQEDMVVKLFKSKRVIVDSVSGSGKTTVLTQAMNLLKNRDYVKRVYYIVFPVQEGALGYLPGGVPEKIKEYAVPFMQALADADVPVSNLDLDIMCDEFSECDFKVVPHTFMRGRTVKEAGIILDEVQNGTVDEIQKVLTRISDCCYVGIAGHNKQVDINNSGFPAYIHHFKQGVETGIYTDISFAKLTTNYRGKFSSFADEINKHYK